jgi:diguanylate cyclase (GGDEF)-like protein/PAS domain S-box-containing protein
MRFPIPADDAERLAVLQSTGILDTLPETCYDDLTKLASRICEVPIAAVSLIDAERQWFKSRIGIEVTETPREISFCTHTIMDSTLLEVHDASVDDRFRENPSVTCESGLRFYAGMPLVNPEGYAYGSLCVAGSVPKSLTAEQRECLVTLGRQVVALIELRRSSFAAEKARRELQTERDRFRQFMDHSPAMAFLKDASGRFVYVNQPCCNRFGIDESLWLGRTDEDLWGPIIAAPLRIRDRRILETGQQERAIETVPTPDGRSTFWQAFKFPFQDATGGLYLAGMAIDVTAEKNAEIALIRNEERFRSMVERISDGVYLIDNDTSTIIEANPAFLSMMGYTLDELRTIPIHALIAEESFTAIEATRHQILSSDFIDLGDRKYRRKSGELIDVTVTLSRIPGTGTSAGWCTAVVRDVTQSRQFERQLADYQRELESTNRRLRERSTTDALTGIANRGGFNDRFHEEFTRARRSHRALSLMLMDVDHFKSFNDTFGHPAGDRVLKSVAGALAEAIRADDYVARYGGEEFAVILPDTEFGGAMVLAERCRRAVAAIVGLERKVTVSIGVTTLTDATPDESTFLKEADDALYSSKQMGRNRVKHGSDIITASNQFRTVAPLHHLPPNA